jgi:hypothetical protein
MQRTQQRSFVLRLIIIIIGVLLVQNLSGGYEAIAQDDSAIKWDPPVTIKRKEKPRRVKKIVHKTPRRRTPQPRPVAEETVPMLTLQYRILKVRDDGTAAETNPGAVFFPGDRLRLAVKANQDGYVYIIQQKMGVDKPGGMVFPNSRVNGGQNYVKKNQEVIIPSNCPQGISLRDCSLVVTPPAGQEFFTMIFSRDLILDLPNEAAKAGGAIMPNVIRELKRASGQILIRKQIHSAGPYTIWVRNTNIDDNEELIETMVLNKGDSELKNY